MCVYIYIYIHTYILLTTAAFITWPRAAFRGASRTHRRAEQRAVDNSYSNYYYYYYYKDFKNKINSNSSNSNNSNNSSLSCPAGGCGTG